MKKILTIGICLLVFSAAAQAEKMYVNDTIRITIRTGPGINYKVIGEAESGQEMDVRGSRDGWSRVRLSDGREGWVISRFLIRNSSRNKQLTALQEAHDTLAAEVDALKRENERLKEENQRLDLLSGESRRTLEEITHSYDVLKTESRDFLKVKAAYEAAAEGLEEQKRMTDQLKARTEDQEWQKNAAFFVGGGVLVLLGFFVGALSRGDSRRRSSLL